MHEADNEFRVNGSSVTRIRGPEEWHNPRSGKEETVWVRAKADGSKTQYFTCHENGIGRVYDSRGPRHYVSGRCKFPAGHEWQIGKRQECGSTAIEITYVGLDEKGHVEDLIFKWWTGATLDHIYRYVPEYGMTHAWEQR